MIHLAPAETYRLASQAGHARQQSVLDKQEVKCENNPIDRPLDDFRTVKLSSRQKSNQFSVPLTKVKGRDTAGLTATYRPVTFPHWAGSTTMICILVSGHSHVLKLLFLCFCTQKYIS